MNTPFRFLLLSSLVATALAADPSPSSSPSATPIAAVAKPTPKVYKRPVFPPIPAADLAAIEAALPAKGTVEPKQPRKALLFYRAEGHVHESIPYGVQALKRIGEKTGAYTPVCSDDMASFDPETLKQFDVIIFINTTGLKFENPIHRKALLDFVASGKGVVGIHAASDNFPNWPEGQALMGGVFHGHPWHAEDLVAIKLDDPAHPINKAFNNQGFRLQEEIYQITGPYSRDKQRELISLDMSKPENLQKTVDKEGKPLLDKNGKGVVVRTDNDFPIAWVKREGNGRVFYSSLGHNREIYYVPQILQHYLDGIQYALGDLAADDVPTALLKVQPTPALAPDAMTAPLDPLKGHPVPQKQAPVASAPVIAAPVTASSGDAKKAGEAALKDLPKYNYGDSTVAVFAVQEAVRVSSPEERAAFEPKLLAVLNDAATTPAAKETILRLLGWMGSDAAVPSLTQLASSPTSPEVADYAIRALSTIPALSAPKADAALEDLLKSVSGTQKTEVIAALGMRQVSASIPQLAALTSEDSEAGKAALNALALIASPESLQAILNAKSGNEAAKNEALIACASTILKSGNASLPDSALTALGKIASESSLISERTAAAKLLLAKEGTPSPELLALLQSEDYRVRQHIAEALVASLPVSSLAKIDWATSPNTQVMVLTEVTAKATPEDLSFFKASLSSSDPQVKSAAIVGIGKCAAPESLELLLPLALGTDYQTRLDAMSALASSKVAGGDEKLIAAYHDSKNAKSSALLLKVMAARQQHEAFGLVLEATGSSNSVIQSAAYGALAVLATRGDLDPVIGLLKSAPPAQSTMLCKAIVKAANSDASPSNAAKKLAAAYGAADASQKENLISIFALIPVPESKIALQGILAGKDVDTRKSVIRALAAARNTNSNDLLPQVAATGATPSERILALKGYIDTIGELDEIKPPAKIAEYRIAWKAAQRDEEKGAIIAAVKKLSGRNAAAAAFLKEITPAVAPRASLGAPPSPSSK